MQPRFMASEGWKAYEGHEILARYGKATCPCCGREILEQSLGQTDQGQDVYVLACEECKLLVSRWTTESDDTLTDEGIIADLAAWEREHPISDKLPVMGR